MKYLLSQNQIPLGPAGGFRGFGKLGLEGRVEGDAGAVFNQVLSSIIGIMTIIAAIWFIFQFIIGAIGIVSSGGEKSALESAKSKITYGIIGLVVVIASIFLIDLIGNLLGLNILNPAEFILK